MSLSEERLKEIKARCEKATPGPWTDPWRCEEERANGFYSDASTDSPATAIEPDGIIVTHPWDVGTLMVREHDAAFVANSRQDVPDLLGEVERLRALVFEAADAIDSARSYLDFDAPLVGALNKAANDIRRKALGGYA